MKMNRREFVAIGASILSLSRQPGTRVATEISVEAGAFDRHGVVASFEAPADFIGRSLVLRGDADATIPLQVAGRRAIFVLPELRAGQKKQYRLETSNSASHVKAVSDDRVLHITSDTRPVFDFRLQPELPEPTIKPIFKRAGYIHPVFTPKGHIVTDDYPGDHRHQHGIMFAWTKTEFEGRHPDFWNMGSGTAKVELDGIVNRWDGPVHAGFTARLRHIDLSAPHPAAALNEHWEVNVYQTRSGQKPYSIFDIVSTQETAGNSPLVLPEYRYGGMAVRGHRDWKAKDKVTFLTSEGKNRIEGDDQRARWCHMGGRVDGESAGIAMLGHPGNFRAPQPVRIHPDDPYFNFSPSKIGDWEITPGKPYISRYRYIVSDGPAAPAELDRLWNDYANPPKVSVIHK